LSIEELQPWLLIGLVLFVAQGDLRQYRISNSSVLITLIGGMVWNLCFYSGSGLWFSALGILVGFALLLPFYAMGGMTAGDVKWLAALGAWYGPKGVLGLFIVSGIALGLLSMGWIAYRAMRGPKGANEPIVDEDRAEEEQAQTQGAVEKTDLDRAFESPDRRFRFIPYALPVAIGVLLIETVRLYLRMF